MADLKDHDPDEGGWIHPEPPKMLTVGDVMRAWQQRQADEAAQRLDAWWKERNQALLKVAIMNREASERRKFDDNPNIIRSTN